MKNASVAQLDRVPVYEIGGWRFESSRVYHRLNVMFRFIIAIFLFISSCGVLSNKGYYMNEVDIENAKEGITHKDKVVEILGEPLYKIDDNTFLYCSYSENVYGINNTKSYDEKILLLYFDSDGYLERKIFKKSALSEFKYNKYKKDIIKNKDSFIKSVVNGVGVELIQ